MADKFKLSSDKIEFARKHFKEHGWVVVPDFLFIDTVFRWYTQLMGPEMVDEWWHASQVFDAHHTLYVQDIPRNMARVAANRAAAAVPSRNMMVRYSMTRSMDEAPSRNWLMEEIHNFFKSRKFLDTMTEITGLPTTRLEAMFAQRMVTGDFIMPHTDAGKPSRQASFFLNITPKWEDYWGGGLAVDGKTHIDAPYNSLVLVDLHTKGRTTQISMVTTDTNHSKMGLSGWLQDGPIIVYPGQQ